MWDDGNVLSKTSQVLPEETGLQYLLTRQSLNVTFTVFKQLSITSLCVGKNTFSTLRGFKQQNNDWSTILDLKKLLFSPGMTTHNGLTMTFCFHTFMSGGVQPPSSHKCNRPGSLCQVHFKVCTLPLWGDGGGEKTNRRADPSALYSLCYKLVLMQDGGNVSELTNPKRDERWPEGVPAPSPAVLSIFRTTPRFAAASQDENNHWHVHLLSITFFFLKAFSPLSLPSLSLWHCHSLSLLPSLSLCNRIGLSYTRGALWFLAAGFRCLQSQSTF